MLVFKVVPVFLFILVVGAEKKIELQDIEEDNLKSEKEKELEKAEPRAHDAGQGLLPLEFLKNGFLRYFESPTHTQAAPQQQRYVSQYAVTEPPESPAPSPTTKVQYGPPAAQQAMVGYLSNVPMQIYLVPQYYNDQHEPTANAQQGVQYVSTGRAAGYSTAPEAVQTQNNYVEVPSYIAPTGKTFVQQYSSPVAYVGYTQPTVAPATAAPVLTYQVPVMQYPTAIAAPPILTKGYYQTAQFEGNAIDEQDNGEVKYTATDVPYTKSTPEFPRYYSSQAPIREQYRHGTVSELPPPNPLILKPQPSHLAHLPKALPMYRPLTKSVYSGNHLASAYTSRPYEAYGPPYKRRPTSLLDSYIPSSVQLEYLKRGFTKDPLLAYEELSNGRHLSHSPSSHSPVIHSHSSHSPVIPRHYERGFLPNQMYHTAAGGVTFGHYKRTPKIENKASTN
ncbi:uncharacterized protein LOC128674349 [Plodia interpunctella]|uniref:uncharacterized protein LOC128674349 n=1 Tax=Plodia interpunctella TaxID=58824 RepID=UPI0023684418|nr:uncharacterized protein LOC128674349 [Plodia interpunctella]